MTEARSPAGNKVSATAVRDDKRSVRSYRKKLIKLSEPTFGYNLYKLPHGLSIGVLTRWPAEYAERFMSALIFLVLFASRQKVRTKKGEEKKNIYK